MNIVNKKQHIVVLGAGPGGYEAALAASQLGAKVSLIEESGIGGSAVLSDVVPSKSLIFAGSNLSASDIKYKEITKKIKTTVKKQSEDMLQALLDAQVDVYFGRGKFQANNIIEVKRKLERKVQLKFDTTVVAVGASPRTLPGVKTDGTRILNWKQIYDIDSLPEHLVIIGSGVTGVEFAYAFRNLGSRVTLVSSREVILPREDKDAAKVIEEAFTTMGVEVITNSRMVSIRNEGDNVRVVLENKKEITASHALLALGSVPNTSNIGLEHLGITLTSSLHIPVNRIARTENPVVYGVGDCTNSLPLASVASMQGRTAIYHALGDEVNPINLTNVTSNIFTNPEIATVGCTQQDVDSGQVTAVTKVLPIASNPRAKMLKNVNGFVKIFARPQSGLIVGAVVVSPGASEIIFPLALAVEHRLSVDQLARAFPVYPSLSGLVVDVARAMHNS